MSEEIFQQGTDGPEVPARQVSGPLRRALGGVRSALEALAPPERREADPYVDGNAALLCRSYYRLLRLAGNLDALDGPALRLANDDIIGFCRQVTERAEYPAELLGLELEFYCAKASHIIAMDASRLEQLLLNLLSNAFKFTPRGGTVTVEVRLERDAVLLSVSDTGCGLGPETPPGGLGLGLAVCRRIAYGHGGALVLAGREGGGTVVTVSLPNRKAAGGEQADYQVELAGGFNRTLVELADALPKQAYAQRYLD